jgi:hypothetical protein
MQQNLLPPLLHVRGVLWSTTIRLFGAAICLSAHCTPIQLLLLLLLQPYVAVQLHPTRRCCN